MTTIAIASGKGGTGKTFVATNLAVVLADAGSRVSLLDCDVEAPNAHLFLPPESQVEEEVVLSSPGEADTDLCTGCGECARHCRFNAIAVVPDKVLFFPELCHVCGACVRVCPTGAIVEKDRMIGVIRRGRAGGIDLKYGLMKTGEGGMTPRLIRRLKVERGEDITLIDAPPGTTCPTVESLRGVDRVLLVTDPTPFGLNDLKLGVILCRDLGKEPLILVNRADQGTGDLNNYCRREGLRVVGEIPDDPKVARMYSRGRLAVREEAGYRDRFSELADRLLKADPGVIPGGKNEDGDEDRVPSAFPSPSRRQYDGLREITVVSGKGGTGKTSLTACFRVLNAGGVTADCDVDAANLYLVAQPEIRERGWFSGMDRARIDPERCTGCGACREACRFSAVEREDSAGGCLYRVEVTACEGCGVCRLVCPESAVELEPAVCGEWMVSRTPRGPLSHARLDPGGENSGKLVTCVRQKGMERVEKGGGRDRLLMDGAPGTGCPVIASLVGVDLAVVVTEPTVSGIHDLERILDLTDHFSIPAGVIINKADLNPDQTRRIEGLAVRRGMSLLGKIPYDAAFTRAQVAGKSLLEFSGRGDTARQVRKIWRQIRAVTNKPKGDQS